MAFVGSAAVIGGLGAAYQSHQAGRAADAQVKGDKAAIAEQRRQFDLIMEMLQPQRQVGNAALNQLAQLYGLGNISTPVGGTTPQAGSSLGSSGIGISPNGGVNFGIPNPTGSGPVNWADIVRQVVGGVNSPNPQGGDTQQPVNQIPQPTTPNMAGFFTSPNYTFRRDEGLKGIENSFAARGGALSGNALRALNEFNSNLASSEFGNYVNQLNNLAGLGQSATNQGVGAAQYTGSNVGNFLSNSGNARASGIANQSNAWTNLLGSMAMFGGYGG